MLRYFVETWKKLKTILPETIHKEKKVIVLRVIFHTSIVVPQTISKTQVEKYNDQFYKKKL